MSTPSAPPPRRVTLEPWVDRDLSAQVADLSPAFEVGAVVAQAEEILRSAGGHRTPVLVGPPGVGKTSIIHELVRRAHAGSGVPLLRRARVVQLSLKAISARFKDKAEGTAFFADLVSTLLAADAPVVPFFRDVHLAYTLDWEPELHRLLANLPHPALAEAVPREFEQLVEYWSDLSDHLVPLPVEEPSPERMRALVSHWAEHQHGASGRVYRPDAQRASIALTARFMGDRPFPRKALDLLRHTADFTPPDAGPIGLSQVVARFSQMTRVPDRLVDPDLALDLGEVRSFVSDRLLGQDEAVDAVVRMIALMKAGLSDLRRPFGTFLFVGPTGVGKTFCAQLLAEYLFGDRHRLVRLNLADYGSEFHVGTLFGNPHANSVPEQRGLLARRLAGNPFGVLLLDEFEKAHPKVHDGFLQLVDEGRYVNGRGETVSVASLIVIATSNAGAEVYREAGLGFDKPQSMTELDRELDRRLHRLFRFEFLARFDRVVHFHPLDRGHIRSIARRELALLAERDGLTSRELHLDVDAEVLDWLVAHGYHPHFGARFLRREVERHVAGTLAEAIVRDAPPRGARLHLGVRGGRIEVRRVVERVEAPKVVVPTPRGAEFAALDPRALRALAQEWVLRFARLLEEARAREAEAAALMSSSLAAGFWDARDRAQDTLRRYKDLDARIQADRRLARPVARLQALLADDHADDAVLGEVIGEVASAYRRWRELGDDTGASGHWVVLGPADPLADVAAWLTDLVAMYRGWFRRRGLQYELVAEEVDHGRPVRLVFEVEGPGAQALLSMEAGEHRRRAADGGTERALVEVVPRVEPAPEPTGVVEDARRAAGVAIPRRAARCKLELPATGARMLLHGTTRETLGWLARDLAEAWAVPRGEHEVARTYGLRGGGVVDPRTSVGTPNLKDVARGNLDVFWRAWEVR